MLTALFTQCCLSFFEEISAKQYCAVISGWRRRKGRVCIGSQNAC